MVFKVIGGAFVVIACTGFGYHLAFQYEQRLKTIEQLKRMILLLKGEILYANAPLSEALERIGTKGENEISRLFLAMANRIETQQGEPFYQMWKEEIERPQWVSSLNKQDKQGLKDFGEHLGYLDRQMQERTILLYLEQLDMTISDLRIHKREKSRLYTSLGIMGGLFLTIVMC